MDYVSVKCLGGSGGDGRLFFLAIFANPFAGPDGGDGGCGGHVVFRGNAILSPALARRKPVCSVYLGDEPQPRPRGD